MWFFFYPNFSLELRALQLENYALEKQLYMSNAPSSVELNVPEIHSTTLSQSMKHLSTSSPPSPSDLSLTPRKSISKHGSSVTVGRRLPDASQLTSPPKGTFLSATTINNLNVRRHSSSFVGAIESQGRPRRSLPSPGVPSGSSGATNWKHQKRSVGGDEDFSEGNKSRENSPIRQTGVNGGSSGNVASLDSSSWTHHGRHPTPQRHQLRPSTATSAASVHSSRSNFHRSLTPTPVFSLSSEDSASGGCGPGGFEDMWVGCMSTHRLHHRDALYPCHLPNAFTSLLFFGRNWYILCIFGNIEHDFSICFFLPHKRGAILLTFYWCS